MMCYRVRNQLFLKYNLVLSASCIFMLIFLVASLTMFRPDAVFGDGLFQEHLSASFGERKVDLIIKMTPPLVTTETLKNQNQEPVIQFKLYDPSTNEGYKHVTYFITIEKDGKKLLSDWFHDHNGDLKIEMKPSSAKQIAIQVISYYDDIKDFNFDPSKKQIQFTMPFNWNTTRLEDQKQLMVHQEVEIPKGNSLASQSYTGAINGIFACPICKCDFVGIDA